MRPQDDLERQRARIFARLFLIGVWLVVITTVARIGISERSWAPYLTVLGVSLTAAVGMRLAGVTREAISAEVSPRRFSTVAAVVVAIALCGALVRLPATLRSGYESLVAPDQTLAEADVAPLNNDALSASLVAAARVIPRSASYSVLSGYSKVPFAFNLWLMPRVEMPFGPETRWLVLYYAPAPPGLRYRTRVVVTTGIDVLEVEQ